MRKRYRYVDGRMVEISLNDEQRERHHFVQPDIPGYASPVSGNWIEGRRARREDLKRTGCRPYEGREQETKEAAKVRAEWDRQADQIAERIAHRAWAEAPERVRKVFRSK